MQMQQLQQQMADNMDAAAALHKEKLAAAEQMHEVSANACCQPLLPIKPTNLSFLLVNLL